MMMSARGVSHRDSSVGTQRRNLLHQKEGAQQTVVLALVFRCIVQKLTTTTTCSMQPVNIVWYFSYFNYH
eukprot:scaffold4359_cov163-Skeletonema_menzelii.AAC.2